VDYIFLVGGFTESKLLLHHVRNEFERDGLRVVVPSRPGLSVLQGAVMLGMGASGQFGSRIVHFTYCVGTVTRSDRSNPDDRRRAAATVKRKVHGVEYDYVTDGCGVIVRMGTRIAVDETHRTSQIHSIDGSKEVLLTIYATPAASQRWFTDAGMVRLGEIYLPVADGDTLVVELSFGRTEIRAAAVNERTRVRGPAVIDYDFGTL
jgi:hypothetical protein